MMTMNKNGLLAIVVLACSFAVACGQFRQTSNSEKTKFETRLFKHGRHRGVCRGLTKQEGFRAVLMFVADGKYSQLSPNPNVPNCSRTHCDGAYFWDEVIGGSNEIREIETLKAKKFFLEDWGIPVDDYAQQGKIVFSDIYVEPRSNYRCRAMEGERIHRFGWEVHDQNFAVTALEELTIGGKFGGGRTIPPFANIVTGQYHVERSRIVKGKVVGTKKFVKLRYASAEPIYPPLNGRYIASCRITESPWGIGVAYLIANVVEPSETPTKLIWRNIITLDGGDGTGSFDGVHSM